MPYVPTTDERTKVLGDVYYEIQQLAATSAMGHPHQNVSNAIVESRLLHVRSFLDFFERESCSQDDVLAAHYGFPVSSIPVDPPYRERLNKDLAHLTYSRTMRTPSDKPWPHDRVTKPVLERCIMFIDHLIASGTPSHRPEDPEWHGLRSALVSALTLISKQP